ETGVLPAFERLGKLEARVHKMSAAYFEYSCLFPSDRSDAPHHVYEAVRDVIPQLAGSLYGLQEGYVHQRFVHTRETLRRVEERLQRMESVLPDLGAILQRMKVARARVEECRLRLGAAATDLTAHLESCRFALSAKE